MKAIFTNPVQDDYESFAASGLDAAACLDGTIKAIFTDEEGHTGYCFIDIPTYDRLGETYITANTTLCYSRVLDEWMASLSQENYYNDTERNPEKLISVCFVSIDQLSGNEIYKNRQTGRLYSREVSRREPFAKWMGLGFHMQTDGGNELRANLVFEHNGQREKILYGDCNGVAAYPDTFNPGFRPSGQDGR